MTTVLVTGGAGYIGSTVAADLVARGYRVVVFDNLSCGHLDALPAQVEFVRGDLNDLPLITAVCAQYRPWGVLHFASRTMVGESMEKPWLYLRSNYVEGSNLLEAAIAAGTRRFILSSTANLYDNPQTIPITEAEPVNPGSPYGEAKHFLERDLYWLERIYDAKYAVLRYFNAAGATESRGEDHRPEYHLIPLVLQCALGQRPSLKIFGDNYPTRDGTCVRDYIHIADLSQAHILALEALDGGSRLYNLGNGSGYTVREVIDTARRITGRPIPVEITPPRPGDVATLVAGSDNIRRELGWQPRYPDLETIIASAWKWHSTHPRGYVR